MDARYYVTLKKFIKTGDKAVVYTHGGNFVAVVEFVGNHYFSEEDLGWTKGKHKFLFPYMINFRIIHKSKNAPQYHIQLRKLNTKPNGIDLIS